VVEAAAPGKMVWAELALGQQDLSDPAV
jgi:hypothetical protein